MFRFLLKSVKFHFVLTTSAHFIQCTNSHNLQYFRMGLKYNDNDTKQVIIFFTWPRTRTTSGKFPYERDLSCLMSRSTCSCLLLLLPPCQLGKGSFQTQPFLRTPWRGTWAIFTRWTTGIPKQAAYPGYSSQGNSVSVSIRKIFKVVYNMRTFIKYF